MIGAAATVESGSLMEREITVWKTFPECLVDALHDLLAVQGLGEHGHQHAVYTSRLGLMRLCTFLMDCMSSATPRRAKNSAATGMMTPSAAVNAFTVSRPERWLAVDDDDVVLVLQLAQHAGKHLLAPHLGDQLHFGSGQIDIGGDDVEILEIRMMHDMCGSIARIEQRGVHRVLHSVGIDTETHGCSALRVEIDDQATRLPYWLNAPAILMELVVLPTPPF